MVNSQAAFLRTRAPRSFRSLLAELEGVTAHDANQFRTENWPDHRWGIGQNGSIAGIVYHVAAWKQLTLPVFEPGGRSLTRSEFDASLAPAIDDWPGICSWLHTVGGQWESRILELDDDEFDSTRDWEGSSLPLSSFVVEMVEHDIQHAAQIAYIKQLLLCADK